ncbi:leucyl aminopeptidase [Agromyces badenianii]|uniref:Probable cytosol aminopeptidase n=1 Tax=Agromyces badenianii TaxID=2080742 RepID=A0A2S0WVX9_9MICO|nr:leucyl aminopeptidase [Agromyces badenianii]AWB95472.1 leucyl aminopeptidase [Agromyces badenianii]
MAVPILSVTDSPASVSDADVVVLASRKGPAGPELLSEPGFEWVAPLLAVLEVSGSPEELVRIPAPEGGARVVAVAGIGDRADAASLRLAAGSALRQLKGAITVAIAIPTDDAASAAALLEGAALGAYGYDEYRSEPKPRPARITLHSAFAESAIGIERVRSVVAAVARTKDLVNMPPADLFPARLAEIAVDAAGAVGITARVWDEEALAADGFGGILAVGKGSSRGPRLVRLEYAPAGASAHLALVGKGITYDSGGLSLKPMGSLVGMKTDMAGAAAILSAMVALAELEAPIRVTGWLCLAENLPSSTAMRPNDVLRIRGGKTVEVLNTDAEGRLVLADGLVAASEEQPDAIVDVATLTGAQVVALGHRIAGVMGDDALVERVRDAADSVDERTWPMPLPRDLMQYLKSDVADLTNTKLGMTVPGMLLAGVFLQEFVGVREGTEARIPWAHLDIAGPSNNTGGAFGFTGSGATGVAVRTLVRLAEHLAAE